MANSISPSDDATTYDAGTIFLHWAMAALVAALWIIGQTGDLFPKGPLRAGYWSLHVTLGFALAVLLIVRIAWRRTGGRELPPADSGVRQIAAKTLQYALYVLLAATILGGIANAFVRGFNLFGVVALPQIGDKALKEPITEWHGLAANLVLFLALLHSAAGLAHHYILKDSVLARMLPNLRSASKLNA